ncbi:hypothetical protein A7X94_11340 [Stenotrophomonas maltophilia]|nr:hypothetical protein A7X94_11340 [Stenotrophomonas maltophilia]
MFNVCKEFRFDAAHQLDAGPNGDPRYRSIHGHSYQVEVWARGPRNARGWVIDMGDLERRIALTNAKIDHVFLNEIEGMGPPTMENIAYFIWCDLRDLPLLRRVVVKRGQNGESCEFHGEYDVG